MSGDLLVLNSGSSSIKFSIFRDAPGDDGLCLDCRGEIEGIGGEGRLRAFDAQGQELIDTAIEAPDGPLGHRRALQSLEDWLNNREAGRPIEGIGHRVVHGGETFRAPALINRDVLDRLQRLSPLAPLHQPHNLAPVRELADIKPGVPQVACFDTAFHHTQARVEQIFALPAELTESGVRRYGFHGLSYEYIAGVLPRYAGSHADGRVVIAHLGNGASMCALRERRSVATTMGFTALEGLPMGTRCGAIDPGVLLYLMQQRGMSVEQVSDLLYKHSGLLGVSGISNDMRELLASSEPAAALAVSLFEHRIVHELGALAATLQGLDALVFTGGIGEHAAPVRAAVCRAAAWLGIALDENANDAQGPCITRRDSRIPVYVIPTNEELMIARHTRALVSARAAAQD